MPTQIANDHLIPKLLILPQQHEHVPTMKLPSRIVSEYRKHYTNRSSRKLTHGIWTIDEDDCVDTCLGGMVIESIFPYDGSKGISVQVFILSEHRNQGIAKALIDTLSSVRVRAWIPTDNLVAKHLAASFDFRTNSKRTEHQRGEHMIRTPGGMPPGFRPKWNVSWPELQRAYMLDK